VLAGKSDANDEVCLNSIGSRVGAAPASRDRKKSRRPPAASEAAQDRLTTPATRFSVLEVPVAIAPAPERDASMRTETRTFALESLLAAGAVVTAGGGWGKGWKRVEVSVADNNQFRGPEGVGDFLSLPPALGGTRYYQNR
jgi:hypothetical protein